VKYLQFRHGKSRGRGKNIFSQLPGNKKQKIRQLSSDLRKPEDSGRNIEKSGRIKKGFCVPCVMMTFP